MTGKPRDKVLAIATAPAGTWVQTDREGHEKWATLTIHNPRASGLLHLMISQMGHNNALIASQANLARMAGCSVRTLQRSLSALIEHNWVEARQIGASGTVNAYIINDRVAWSGARDGIRYSMFSAAVLVSDDEQPDLEKLGSQNPLTRIPALFPGERQLPAGNGLPPPSQPSLPMMEADLPFTIRPLEESSFNDDETV
jgi:hypothetical protein